MAIACDEQKLAEVEVRATGQQIVKWLAEPLGEHTWAVESAGGLGYLLSQQLVGAGERVLDVPPTLASGVRVLGTGKSNKNDPNDALSVAIAALRSPGLRSVEPADHREVLRLPAKRSHGIGRLRDIVVSRLHAALANLEPGGISKELNASDAVRTLCPVRVPDRGSLVITVHVIRSAGAPVLCGWPAPGLGTGSAGRSGDHVVKRLHNSLVEGSKDLLQMTARHDQLAECVVVGLP